jgi:endonuclease/exonuclease/phosphatase family metal-dependent hydrolase
LLQVMVGEQRTDPRAIVMAAFGCVLGLESVRVAIASIAWWLRDTVGVGTLDLIPVTLAPFLAAALFPLLARVLGMARGLAVAVGVLAVARLIVQMADSPALLFGAAAVGAAAFVGLLPLLLSLGRPVLMAGFLLGLALDAVVKGLGGSLDLAYRSGAGATAAAIALIAGFVSLAVSVLRSPVECRGPGWSDAWPLIGFGPLLFVQAAVLQAPGWVSEVAGIPPAAAPVVITAGNLLALVAVARLNGNRRWMVAGSVVLTGVVLLAEQPGTWFVLGVPAAIAASGLVWSAMVREPDRSRLGPSASALVTGGILFVVLGLAFYLPLDLRLPFTQSRLLQVVAIVLGLVGLLAAVGRPEPRPSAESSPLAGIPALAGILVVASTVPLVLAVVNRPVGPTSTGLPVTVMSYNLHSGFDTSGRMDLEAIARVIEESGAEIVGLQEVDRSQLLNAGTDVFGYLQQRLRMPYAAFFGTTVPVWGNAVLSRHPILGTETVHLPTVGTPMRRGYLGTRIDLGEGTEILFVSTHLQHINDSAAHEEDPEADLLPVHTEQIGTILGAWGDRTATILVGDFNARPGWRQLDLLFDAGFVDAWEQAGSGPGYTANAADPRYRIDWIFHTGDLATTEAQVIESRASDHFAVVAVIDRN